MVLVLQANAATKTSTGGGNWNTNGTWSPSGVPTCGDSIIIQAGHTVNVNTTLNQSGCTSPVVLVIKGTLQFGNGQKMFLPCNSRLYIYPGAQILAATGGQSNLIEICGVGYWSGANGNYSGPGCMPPNYLACSAALPVLISHFSAASCFENICLSWHALVEINNDHYQVEKLSHKEEWIALGVIEPKILNSTLRRNIDYEFTDHKPWPGMNYYRLLQSDLDHSSSVLGVTGVLHHKNAVKPEIQFQKAGQSTYLTIQNYDLPVLTIRMFDLHGGEIGLLPLNNEGTLTYDTSLDLPEGVYLVVLSRGSHVEKFKVYCFR